MVSGSVNKRSKLKILFLHHNYPGQFANLVQYFKRECAEVRFICDTNYHSTDDFVIATGVGKSPSTLNEQLIASERFLSILQKLSSTGWSPDLVISHSGWSTGSYLKYVFPNARWISFYEWSFSHNNNPLEETRWSSIDPRKRLLLETRNMTIYHELALCDRIVCPTQWQLRQLPLTFRGKASVIHDGIDTDYFRFNRLWMAREPTLITYTTRGMEPMRGFPEMIESIIPVLRDNADIKLIIAGEDRVAYGSGVTLDKSFGEWAATQFSNAGLDKQVEFVGRLPRLLYARLLKKSSVHIYFSRPFVVSWSLLEAMSSGCLIVANYGEHLSEVLPLECAFWCNLDSSKNITDTIRSAVDALDDEKSFLMRTNARIAAQRYDVKLCVKMWDDVIGALLG